MDAGVVRGDSRRSRVGLLLLAAAVLFVACQSGPGASSAPTGSGAVKPAKAAQPPKPTTFTFKGQGSRTSKSFQFGLPARIEYAYSGTGPFSAVVTDNRAFQVPSTIADAVGTTAGITWLYGDQARTATIRVSGKGRYSIKVTSHATVRVGTLPKRFAGRWWTATAPFRLKGDLRVRFSHRGRGAFVVSLVDATTGRVVDTPVNRSGRSSGQTTSFGLDGVYALDVVANGAWSVAVARN
ncbi:MAG: hypothetical protein ACJ761_11200 [Chloroflexota bacterium]